MDRFAPLQTRTEFPLGIHMHIIKRLLPNAHNRMVPCVITVFSYLITGGMQAAICHLAKLVNTIKELIARQDVKLRTLHAVTNEGEKK